MFNKFEKLRQRLSLENILRLNYLAVLVTILLGVLVKLTDSGSACGPSWPFCPPLAENFSWQALIEFSHRLATFLIGVIFCSSLLITLKKRLTSLYELTCLVFFLLSLEAVVGKIIVIFDLPSLSLSYFKLALYSVHPVLSVLLLVCSGFLLLR
ncbi:MAG: hypothetical protein NZT61_07745, partial [Deltaproteobacteria bacterium]|nr:hypothetical protein [Deltaproteobacteria bacterium]